MLGKLGHVFSTIGNESLDEWIYNCDDVILKFKVQEIEF
jgi:hypothetical protein